MNRGRGSLAAAAPMASCIMPTANRRAFVPQAIRLFLAQDYADKELVILDDGEDPVGDLVAKVGANHPQVRYVRDPQRRSIGAKRNRACEAARGEVILHWDDDDWYAGDRIRVQVEELVGQGADVGGLAQVMFVDPRARQAWEYVHPIGGPPWVHGATLCYRRSFWAEHPFADVALGEDVRFVARVDPARLALSSRTDLYLGLIHSANTSPKRALDGRWRPSSLARVEAAMTEAWSDAAPKPCSAAPAALLAAGGGIGDILRITPLARVLHAQGYAVDLLLAPHFPEIAQLLEGAPEIRRLHLADDGANALAGADYELSVLTAWAPRWAREVAAKKRLRFSRTQWTAQGDPGCCASVAEALGWTGLMPPMIARASPRDFGLEPGAVVLHPGCKTDWPWKKWHGFAELAAKARQVAVVGTSADLDNSRTYFRAAFDWPDHALDFVGRLNLADTAALIAQGAALIANDSGLMHLGVALERPTLGVFGITDPGRECAASPWLTAVKKAQACGSACDGGAWSRRNCAGRLACLKSLDAEDVATRLDGMIAGWRRTDRLAAATAAPPAGTISLAYHGPVFDATGYGQAARSYVHALQAAGVAVSIVDTGAAPPQIPDPVLQAHVRDDPEADFHLFHGVPPQWSRAAAGLPNAIGMTVWETDSMPLQWRGPLTRALDVWLPCAENVEVFAAALGRQPFRLAHPRPPLPRDGARRLPAPICGEDFVVYSIFEWQDRKNPEGMIAAFLRAFPDGGAPLLVLKTSPAARAAADAAIANARAAIGGRARIVAICEAWSDAEIAALHRRGDAYLSLHRGEGWGYPLFEAACRGKPVVATAHGGPLDYLDPAAHWLTPHRPTPVHQRYIYFHPGMTWAEPDIGDAAEGLRRLYAEAGPRRAAARRSAARLNRTYSLERIGREGRARLMELLRTTDPAKHRRLSRPARRVARPAPPIPGDWYDADYFETGAKSNWRNGYDLAGFGPLFEATADSLVRLFPNARRVLDAGCAKGFLVRALRARGLDARGFDHSAYAIAAAEPEVRPWLHVAGVEDAQWPERFDLLVALSVLESLSDVQVETALRRAAGWVHGPLFAVIESFDDADEVARAPDEGDHDLSHWEIRSRGWWRAMFRRCGWGQDAALRRLEVQAAADPLVRRMGWQVYVYAPTCGEGR